MKSHLTIICLFVLLFFLETKFVFSQEFVQAGDDVTSRSDGGFNSDNLIFGGGLGFQFGTSTIINVAPQVGYRFTEKLSFGIGVTYLHYSSSLPAAFSTSIYGGNIFGSYLVFENVFVRAEYELLSLESKFFNPLIYPDQERFNVSSMLVGGGYRFQLGERSYLNLLVMWNLNESQYSPYTNPVIRMNFEF